MPRRLLTVLGIIGAALATSIIAAPSPFVATGEMRHQEVLHTATLLPNGKVLVAGGLDFEQPPNLISQLYDPATGMFSDSGEALTYFTAATLLNDGHVLATGGYSASTQLFEPASGTFSATGNLLPSRVSHTAILLPNGKVLVCGGQDSQGHALALCQLYDVVGHSWSATGSLKTGRTGHTATLLPNGKVLIAGGAIPATANTATQILASTEIYDPQTGQCTAASPMKIARQVHTATLLRNGRVLIAGGYSSSAVTETAEIYDPATQQWSETASLAVPRQNHNAVLLSTGKVLVLAGDTSSPEHYVANAELYDPFTGRWTVAGPLVVPRSYTATILLPSGDVLVAGGEHFGPPGIGPAGVLKKAELYSPGRSQNVSTRGNILTGDNVLIGGFIIGGNAPTKVIIRALGPSLGLAGALHDTTLELHYPDGSVVANNDWKVDAQTGQSQEALVVATTIPPPDSLESAIVKTLPPGAYTAVVRGLNGTSGIGMVEVYDLGSDMPTRLANISTRGVVSSDSNVMIAGFILGPTSSGAGQVIIRALGPSLGLNGALADPTIELHDSNGAKIASNDNWRTDAVTNTSQEQTIRSTGIPPANDSEAAIVAQLAPGSYTAIVAGKDGTSGVALVEVYSLQ